MKKLLVRINGTRRLIIYVGEISELPQEMHDRALEDPAFERSLLTAAKAIHFTRKAQQLGEQMCQMILSPQKH